MSIKTDSTPLAEPKALRGSILGEIFSLFASREEFEDLERRLATTKMGWGHAKEELFQLINRELAEPRRTYQDLRKDEKTLSRILQEGAQKAYEIGRPVLDRVRKAVGVGLISY